MSLNTKQVLFFLPLLLFSESPIEWYYSLINSHYLFLCDKYIILITSLVRHDFNSVTTLIDENIRDRGSSLQTTINYSAADEVLRTRCVWTAKNSACLVFFFLVFTNLYILRDKCYVNWGLFFKIWFQQPSTISIIFISRKKHMYFF